MRRALFACAVALSSVFNGCSPRIVERIVTEVRDTTIVEVRERVVHDTARVEIPLIIERNVTPDDSSHLENAYAVSDAYVKDGILHHDLNTKPQVIYVPVDVNVADTTTTHEHYEKTDSTAFQVKEVEKPLSWWKRFKIGAFWPLCGCVILLLAWVFRKRLLTILKIV